MSSGTARLKRRLDEQGVNYTSKKAAENYCLIGTPLPSLEKKDANEFVPLWKQEVRDEKGRRRLHGAFTGGFSAGYFNSVGSKEGWTPSTFVSSRVDRAKQKASRPEDYMDEDDLAELRENQIMAGVKQQQQQGAFGSPQPEPAPGDSQQDSIAASIQRALMPPLEDSPGVRLLKKMGWRPGQGVGPRVSWRMRKIQDLLAAGKSINGVDIDALDDDEEAKRHMYPPRDTVVPRFPMKSDSNGLGFAAGPGLVESLGQKRPEVKGPTLAAGFGLGALNEADDDDIDIYDSASRAERTYMPYDSTRDADESASLSKNKANHKAVGATTTQQKFSNGLIVLSGFVLSPESGQKDQWFPVPEVPSGWKPDPRRVWQKDPNAEKSEESAPTQAAASKRQKLTADERGAILGEEPLPSTRSVFDYLSKEDRERIEHAAAGLHPSVPESTPPAVEVPSAPSSLPYTAPQIASAALKGFMPFANDLAKQERYVAYLRSQATPDHPELLPPKLPDQTSEVYHKELSDYSKSAAIFKPVSGAMASRFTTAAVVDSGPTAVEGLHQPVHAPETAPVQQGEGEGEGEKEAPRREDEEVQSSKAHAARTGMYGALTREITPWQPSRLLCKRFGVKDPNPDITTDTPMPGASRNQPQSTAGGDTWKAEEALAEADLQTATGSATNVGPSSTPGHRAPRDLENIGLGEDESQGRDTLTYVRPSMDIFKAIFASDDEGDDEDENGGGGPEEGRGDDKVVPTASQAMTAPTDGQVHDATTETTVTTYEPKSADRPSADSVTVDIATFKPVFVPRAERRTQKSKDKDKTDVRVKDKKRVKSIVSFEDDDEGATLVIAPQADKDKARKKKKRRKEEEKGTTNVVVTGNDEDTEMWIEKAPPQVVASFADAPPAAEGGVRIEGASAPPPTSLSMQVLPRTEGPPRGRKRAIDFL
ncbi:hypothetical protein EI94DRAFT_1676992 [Lactarius quietus]|nr:hypothetical protein EI94DRAFT_1676992 [Lactarius quietus]